MDLEKSYLNPMTTVSPWDGNIHGNSLCLERKGTFGNNKSMEPREKLQKVQLEDLPFPSAANNRMANTPGLPNQSFLSPLLEL